MARDFTGSATSYLIASSSSIVNLTGQEITISCWINPDTVSISQACITKYHPGVAGSRQYALSIDSSGAPFFTTADGSSFTDLIGTIPLKVGSWTHVLGRQNANALEIWGDGKLQNSSASVKTMVSSSAWLTFAIYHNSAFPYDGKLAEVGIWDHCLSNDEVRQLYRGASPGSIRPSRLRGYWPFTDYGASGVAKDRSPYNQTLDMGAAGVALSPQHPSIGNIITLYAASVIVAGPAGPPTIDADTVYLNLSVTGTDEYNPPCFLIGEGEAQLRWTASDDFLRWLGNDANLRWDAQLILGTAQC